MNEKNNYIITGCVDWADEMYVYFLEILNQDEYDKYNFAKNTLKEYRSSYYFGTNEGWDGDFDYLQFNPQIITDEEIEVLNKFNIGGMTIYDDFMNSLNDDEDIWYERDLRSLEFDEFYRVINKYKSIIDEQ